MKKRIVTVLFISLLMVLFGPLSLSLKNRTMISADGGCVSSSSLPTTIDLNDNSESDIRAYYSSLDGLSENELKGNNLLKNLKTILYNMTYYSYDAVWKIYEITDRDWTLSPVNEIEYGSYSTLQNKYVSYQYSTTSTTRNNPYVHSMYNNPDGGPSSYARAWGNHNQSDVGINREHIWPQSRGFKASTGASGPAGTDLHHLVAANGYVNGVIHNNSPYGNVDPTRIDKDAADHRTFLSGNLLGYSSTFSSSTTKVFEPQDSDKGDIARACFYMVARYNNIAGVSGVISDFEPYLRLVNEVTDDGAAESGNDTKPVDVGILQDLLEWHHQDPVDEYEIHRNNLIYNNYQHNRNPFIDFPEWADYIWGTVTDGDYSSTPTGKAAPATDAINEYNAPATGSVSLSTSSINIKVGESATISATSSDNSNIAWTVGNNAIISVNKTSSSSAESITVNAVAAGNTTLKAEATIGGTKYTKTCNVTITQAGSSSTDPVDPSPTDPEPTEEEEFNIVEFILGNLVIFIAFVAVLIFIAIVIVILANRNKKVKKAVKKVAKKTVKNAVRNANKKK